MEGRNAERCVGLTFFRCECFSVPLLNLGVPASLCEEGKLMDRVHPTTPPTLKQWVVAPSVGFGCHGQTRLTVLSRRFLPSEGHSQTSLAVPPYSPS